MTQPVIVVTGASSGIGAATARLFGQRGYRTVLAARRRERLEALAEEIRAQGGEALVVPCDLTRLEDIERLAQETLQAYGQVDVLLNNAGFGRLDWLENLDPVQDIERQFRVNLLGVILTTRAFLPHMIARRRGHIITTASVASWVASPTYTIYAASKFAVRGFTEALCREVSVYGIHVGAVYPGAVDTEFGQHTGAHRKTGATTPKALRLKPEQVAETIWKMVQRPRRGWIIPWPMRLVVWFNAHLPGLVDWITTERFTKIERGLKE